MAELVSCRGTCTRIGQLKDFKELDDDQKRRDAKITVKNGLEVLPNAQNSWKKAP